MDAIAEQREAVGGKGAQAEVDHAVADSVGDGASREPGAQALRKATIELARVLGEAVVRVAGGR